MELLTKSKSSKSLVSILLILFVVLLRFSLGGFDWTYFVVLGNDSASETLDFTDVMTQEGAGYDGQFYYGLAQEPFSFEKVKGGVIIDHPPYRHQRIFYPFLVHLASFGIKSLVPFMLVLINVISLFVISQVVSSFQFLQKVKWSFLLPFLISGLWMSLSRDLTECVEVAFLMLAFYGLLNKKLGQFILFSSAVLLTRETSIIYVGAMAVMWFWRDYEERSFSAALGNLLFLSFPVLLLAGWKYMLLISYPTSEIVSAGSNITFPFNGIYMSFVVNLNGIETTRDLVEFAVWITFIIWQFTLFALGIRSMVFQFKANFVSGALSVLSLIGICFASLFSISIYIDDWAFLRILAALDVFLMLLVLERKKQLPNWFLAATVALAVITIIRVIVRV